MAGTPRVFEQICAHIQAALTRGELQPGDKLPAERELAAFYGVSRVVVREALRHLEKVGVLARRGGTRGGVYLQQIGAAPLTDWMRDLVEYGSVPLADLTEARSHILEAVVRLACVRATDADLAALEANAAANAALLADGSSDARIAAAMAFYDLLATAARNQVLALVVKSLTTLMTGVLAQMRPAPAPALVASRQQLVRRLRARDAQGAVRALRAHLQTLHGTLSG